MIDCFLYKTFDPKSKVAVVELTGNIIHGVNKSVANNIEIVKELSWNEVLNLVNSGHGNTGCRNSGDMNSGDMNSGYRNLGDKNSGYKNFGYYNSGEHNLGSRNSGNFNSGNYNSGNYNSGNMNSGNWNLSNHNAGFFNTKENTVMIFNKDSGLTYREFTNKYPIPWCLYFSLTKFIYEEDMTEQEKTDHPGYVATGGYLKRIPYKEAAIASISRATEEEKAQIRALPNYDPDIFEEIFGIRI
jgi:hypothetical protein